MLNALEDDPDEEHRWRRLLLGGAIAAAITCLAVYTANTYAPARELMKRVVRITIATPPPEVDDKPLPPLPPPPPPKPQPKKAEKQEAKEKAPVPKPDANPTPADPTEVGMDSQSFAEGGSGPGFHVGGNQMGDPNNVAAVVKPPAAVAVKSVRATKYLMAKPLAHADVDSLFSKRARKLGLSGLMLIELTLDAGGKVRSAKIRKGLESLFDTEVLSAVKNWAFEPPGALAPGEAVADVRLLRLRFSLATN